MLGSQPADFFFCRRRPNNFESEKELNTSESYFDVLFILLWSDTGLAVQILGNWSYAENELYDGYEDKDVTLWKSYSRLNVYI